MKLEKFFLITLLLVIASLFFYYYSSYKKEMEYNKEGYFFLSTQNKQYIVLQSEYLKKILTDCFKPNESHIYMKVTGFMVWYKNEWRDINMINASFRSMGFSSNVVIEVPQWYFYGKVEGFPEKTKIDGVNLSLFSPDCKKGKILFIDLKKRKINVEGDLNIEMENLSKNNSLVE